MIYEIKIESFPGKSLSNIWQTIKKLENRAKKAGMKVTTNKLKSVLKEDFTRVVCEEVGRYYDVHINPNDLILETRSRPIVESRRIIYKKMRQSMSLSEAGRQFNQKHCNVIDAIKKVDGFYETDKRYRELITTIEKRTNVKLME